jgi:uncharacterized ferritin-like protein (DUF455 family)
MVTVKLGINEKFRFGNKNMNLFTQAYQCLMESNVEKKRAATTQLYTQWQAGQLKHDKTLPPIQSLEDVGRPPQPELVSPAKLKRRSLHTEAGRAALIHAIVHIEFNAINLALDAVYRFRDMPRDYYGDWLKVAKEEAYHYGLLQQRLQKMGYQYGDFPAHNGLWEMTVKTAHDVLVRMALVPRVLEARGLDVTPKMIQGLQQAGDQATVDILNIIFQDEIGHVAIGSRWFHYCCQQRNLDSIATFQDLLTEYMGGGLRGKLHIEARLQAGFSQAELDQLTTANAMQ